MIELNMVQICNWSSRTWYISSQFCVHHGWSNGMWYMVQIESIQSQFGDVQMALFVSKLCWIVYQQVWTT